MGRQGNRVGIIAMCTILWSGAVALCGAAGNFIQLVFIRMSVGIDEAGSYAPSLSLISDQFDRDPRAMARYPIGIFITYFLAGWVTQWFGWRAAFVVFGPPGLIWSGSP